MPQDPQTETSADWPRIKTAGYDGFLISFADALNEPANRAALAFRAAIDAASWGEVAETSTSLVSAYLRFDPLAVDHATMAARLDALAASRDWFAAELPDGRKSWRIPAVFGTDLAPQLAESAKLAGMSEAAAIADFTAATVRVQTIGFAPGAPYLGELPPAWDIPRQTGLTPQVPVGALCVAIRQFVMFPVTIQTGWRHVAQTAFRLFRPEAAEPFMLRPGDEVRFIAVTPEEFANIGADPDGGAAYEAIR